MNCLLKKIFFGKKYRKDKYHNAGYDVENLIKENDGTYIIHHKEDNFLIRTKENFELIYRTNIN